MGTLVYTHPGFAGHVTPPGHPEQVARLASVARAIATAGLTPVDAPMGDVADVLRCHPQSYFDKVANTVPARGWAALDGDTHLSPGSLTAALRAVGGMVAAVDAVMAGTATNAFVAGRPPGHHAETATAMGFCLFGTVAIGAKRLLDHHGLSRVAIVDFDVHHGNGTQDLLWDESRVLFISSHQMPLYPGSGASQERGAHGQIINIPLRTGSGGAAMRAAYDAQVFPALAACKPEFILISAGFDAHEDDPLAGLNWQDEDYAWITRRLLDIADAHCGGRVVSTLEGGYDLEALQYSVAAHLGAMKERGE
ncbi:MAG: acetoin utilization protein [Comamonadaceae bacterium PBBC2]|nr:MAG: acetoin utilization protein [Comamonadaceae bacterium PBBC2]